MQLEAAQILRRRRIGRAADEGRERPHLANVVAVRLLGEAAHRHVFDHARTQRADGPGRRSGGHRGGPLRAEGCWTFDARDRMPRSSPLTAHPLTATPKMHRPRRRPPARAGSFPAPYPTFALRSWNCRVGRKRTFAVVVLGPLLSQNRPLPLTLRAPRGGVFPSSGL